MINTPLLEKLGQDQKVAVLSEHLKTSCQKLDEALEKIENEKRRRLQLEEEAIELKRSLVRKYFPRSRELEEIYWKRLSFHFRNFFMILENFDTNHYAFFLLEYWCPKFGA